MIESKPILFSAIQPSGKLTLGNYLGTMQHWSLMQEKYQCLYCIADLHALTTVNKKMLLKESILDTLALYLACGIDPNKSIIFVQSHVHQHCELNWILNCFSHFGELLRMTQFKTKSNKNYVKKNHVGLFNYPVLMAADILLYQSNIVPIGQDQRQHLELARDIANRFNSLYGNVFTIPVPMINRYGSKIMSLVEPTKKMSKSDTNINNVIFLLENKISLFLKIKNAVTDSEKPARIYYDLQKKSGISNLLEIFSAITHTKINFLEKEFDGILYSEFKNILSEKIFILLDKIQKSYSHYRNNTVYLQKIACEGAIKARYIADLTLKKIHSELNFFTF